MDAHHNSQQQALFAAALKFMIGAGTAFVALLPVVVR